ncbi:MAG: transcriptional regulator, MarR family [Herbinix sp.]|nr:transcriptional regulator, MarR family [Herbinix sp.]
MLIHNLSIITRYSNIFTMRRLQKFEIGYAEYGILIYLVTNEKANQDSIAQYYMIDKGAIAKTIKKLENKNYINRQTNKRNQREKLITLTATGKSIIDEMKSLQNEWNDILSSGITEEELNLFTDIAMKISKNATNHINGGDTI